MSRVRSWLRGRRPEPRRWVVVDTETTGLDTARDALVSVGAVAIVDGELVPEDSFEMTLRQDAIRSGPDILVHGIGVGSQRAGVGPAEAIDAFLAYLRAGALVGFHAAFDHAVLRRACTEAGRRCPRGVWLDVADLAAVLRPDLAARCRSLDEWLSAYRIRCDNRHNAAIDAWATAELLLVLMALARRHGIAGFNALRRVACSGRWMGRTS